MGLSGRGRFDVPLKRMVRSKEYFFFCWKQIFGNRVHRKATHSLLSDSWILRATKPISKTRHKLLRNQRKEPFVSDERVHKDAELLWEHILSQLSSQFIMSFLVHSDSNEEILT